MGGFLTAMADAWHPNDPKNRCSEIPGLVNIQKAIENGYL